MIGLALLALTHLSSSVQADAWAQAWTELETLRGGKTSTAEASALREHLGDALRKGAGGPREELLGAALEALAGRNVTPAAVRLSALDPSPFTPRELWFLVDLLPAGPERARLLLAALDAQPPLADWQVLLAWNIAVDETRALRFQEGALPIQLRLHERYEARWSAEDLASTYRALGQWGPGAKILEQAIAVEQAAGRQPAGLWEKQALQALGLGDETSARDYLGLALAQGSDDAGLLLSRLDLVAGRTDDARRGFQALILAKPPPDWAWRGWGTALLPPAFAPSIQLNRSSLPE